MYLGTRRVIQFLSRPLYSTPKRRTLHPKPGIRNPEPATLNFETLRNPERLNP